MSVTYDLPITWRLAQSEANGTTKQSNAQDADSPPLHVAGDHNEGSLCAIARLDLLPEHGSNTVFPTSVEDRTGISLRAYYAIKQNC